MSPYPSPSLSGYHSGLGVTQVLPLQQPVEHDVTSHVHDPPTHRRPDPQWLPQNPQLFGSLAVLAQVPLQLVVPDGHSHVPGPVLEQVKLPAHVPQLCELPQSSTNDPQLA